MWFIDHALIAAHAGDGGRGSSAFAQPPYTRYPYPDGGDGGDGGDILMRADPNVATLLDFHFRHEFAAHHGGHGGSNNKTGKRGNPLTIRVPVGTLIRDTESGQILRDLTSAVEQVIIARGGKGGLGNHSAPQAVPGQPGEHRRLTLELKLIADVGLIGFPNAGKSSLLSRISTAKPKIGAYPFTTRYPVLGVVDVPERGTLVACDIPGLIEGAHQGKGLGIQFLRHIERTVVLVHLIDMAAVDGRDPVEAYVRLNEELDAYSPSLRLKPQVIAANKMDIPEAADRLAGFLEALKGRIGPVWPVSCATGAGIPELLHAVWSVLLEQKLSLPVRASPHAS